MRTRDVPRILPTRPRTPESTPEQEEDEFTRLRNEERSLLAAMGGATEALGYATGGEESPAINTTEEEQVEKVIIKGALQMDKEKENTQRKREHVYESPSGTPTLSSTLAPPLITWESDDEPSIKIPGLATRTDPTSELKSITGGTESLYLNLTPSEAEEASNEVEGPGTSTNHSQAAALLAELEELQQKGKSGKDVGTAPPKLNLAAKLEEKDGSSGQPSNLDSPPNPDATKTIVNQTPKTGSDTANAGGQEAAPTGTSTDPSTQSLKTDGGVKPKTLLNPPVPVRVQPQFDFYLPGGKKTSESMTYQINDLTPEGNPAIMIKIPKLQEKYNQDMYMLDQQTGHLYQIHDASGGFQLVMERGCLHPTESIWADMNEVSREEYLRMNDLNRELSQNNNPNQSKVTSTPLIQSNASEKKSQGEKTKGLGKGDGLSPIIKEPNAPRKPPRLEEVPGSKPKPTPQTTINRAGNEGQDGVVGAKTPSTPVSTKIKEVLESIIDSAKTPKTPVLTTPLKIDPAVLNKRRSEMLARLPEDVNIPAATGASPLKLIEDEEYYLRKLREIQEGKIRIVSLRRQHNLMGYGPEITEYIGPIYEERQRRFEEQEIVVKKIIIKIHQLKDKWCYPIIFPLATIPPGMTAEEQKVYYKNERVLCETLRRATSEIYQRRIKAYKDPREQDEEINRWKQWIEKIMLKERELAERIKEMQKSNVQWEGQITNLEPRDITVDDTLPRTPAEQVLQDNVDREHTVPGVVYSREVSRTNSTSRPTDDEARQSQEEAIELCKKICSITEDDESYTNVRAREEKNKKNLINSREFVENVRRRSGKVTPRNQDERNNRRRIRNHIAPSEEALRILLEEQTEKLAAEREETLKQFIQAVQQGMQDFGRIQGSPRSPRRRRRNEQGSTEIGINERITEVPRPPTLPPQTYEYRNPVFDAEQKFGEEVTPVADQTPSTKTYLLDETKEPTPVRVDYDPKNPDIHPNVSFPITSQPRQTRYEETVEDVSETEMKRTYKKGERERENNYPGNGTANNAQNVPIVTHAGGGSDPPGPGGGPGKGPPDDGSGGDRDYNRRRRDDNGRGPG